MDDSARLKALEDKVDLLWTDVFSGRIGSIGDGQPSSRQTLRGAVLDLCSARNEENRADGKTRPVNPPEPPPVGGR